MKCINTDGIDTLTIGKHYEVIERLDEGRQVVVINDAGNTVVYFAIRFEDQS